MIAVKEEVLRLAKPEDYPAVVAILTDPDVATTFGSVRHAPEDLDKVAIFMFDGGLFGVNIQRDYSAKLHLAVLPSGRGRKAISALQQLIWWFFTETPCPRIFGWSASDHRANLMFNRMVGARPRSARNGKTLFVLTREDWEGQV